MNVRTLGRCTLGLLLPFAVTPAEAQIRASERGGVHQTIDGTTITVNYSRPSARGRSPLFGADVVEWDHIWTPGADWATTLEVDKPVTILGADVPVGKYSVWFNVQDTTAWEVWLEPKDSLWHTNQPDRTDEQIHFMADVQQREVFFETLTWSFSEFRVNGATLSMRWGTTYVPLKVTVESSIELTVSPEAAAPILGAYEMTAEGERPWWNRNLELVYDSAQSWVMSTWSPREIDEPEESADDPEEGDAQSGDDEAASEDADEEEEEPEIWYAALFAVTDEWFTPGWMEDGEVWSVTKNLTLEFEFQDGRAVGYELRNRRDVVVATAKRIE